jgi:hypothetical protein
VIFVVIRKSLTKEEQSDHSQAGSPTTEPLCPIDPKARVPVMVLRDKMLLTVAFWCMGHS